jgi:hypothetical protein
MSASICVPRFTIQAIDDLQMDSGETYIASAVKRRSRRSGM